MENQPLTQCKFNAGGRAVPAFATCSVTANPSLTNFRLKIKFSNTPAWLRADLKGNRFNIPHSTCTNRYGTY